MAQQPAAATTAPPNISAASNNKRLSTAHHAGAAGARVRRAPPAHTDRRAGRQQAVSRPSAGRQQAVSRPSAGRRRRVGHMCTLISNGAERLRATEPHVGDMSAASDFSQIEGHAEIMASKPRRLAVSSAAAVVSERALRGVERGGAVGVEGEWNGQPSVSQEHTQASSKPIDQRKRHAANTHPMPRALTAAPRAASRPPCRPSGSPRTAARAGWSPRRRRA